MGILQYLGLDELADSVNELTVGFEELREEIVTSVIGPASDLKDTVNDIAGSVSDINAPSVDTVIEKIKSKL